MKRVNFVNRLSIQATIVFLVYVFLYEETYWEDEWLLISAVAAVLQAISEIVSFFRGHTISKK